MLKTEKAVAIAKDVLRQIRFYRNVNKGSYVAGNLGITADDLDYDKCGAKEHISEITKSCSVCALGACFLSYVRLFNKVKFQDVVGAWGNIMLDRYELNDGTLGTVFSETQLLLIESAFEQKDMFDVTDLGEETYLRVKHELEDAIDFGKKYTDNKKRLRAIMLNIVKNNGKFIPKKKVALAISSN